MPKYDYKEHNRLLEIQGKIYGYHSEGLSMTVLKDYSDERLKQIAMRRYSKDTKGNGRYTTDAINAQKVLLERKQGIMLGVSRKSPEYPYDYDYGQ